MFLIQNCKQSHPRSFVRESRPLPYSGHRSPPYQQGCRAAHSLSAWGRIKTWKLRKISKALICLSQVTSGSLAYYVFDAGGRQLVGCSGGVYCLVGVYSFKTTYIPSFFTLSPQIANNGNCKNCMRLKTIPFTPKMIVFSMVIAYETI